MKTEEKSKQVAALRKIYDFNFEIIDLVIGGKSIIDQEAGLSGFPMSSREAVYRFLRNYGFDMEDPIERAETQGNFHEALNFIRRHFLKPDNPDGLDLEIPRKIIELTDVGDLLLMSGMHYPGQTHDSEGIALQNWACAILKVVHTIAHIDKDLRTNYFSEIQKQIFDRFYKKVHRDEAGTLSLGESIDDPFRVELVSFTSKPRKSRESLLLKLLHKPESVVDEVFDQVGVRFVTPTRVDSLRVIKFLKESMLILPANIKPSRSRNTLIDISEFKTRLEQLLEGSALEKGDKWIKEELNKIPFQGPPADPENPHTSQFYRAIQFTCRHLIKLKNPLFEDLKELKALAKSQSLLEETKAIIDRMDLKYLQREVRFFYPYEVQVMDHKSAEENEKGLSAHSEYKKAQIRTAMHRVMGSLMNAGH